MKYGFTKQDRSSFSYWFAHWCAYQMVALDCHQWKFKYLFHDWYKPWMRLFCSYDTVQMFHNKHSNHHLLHWLIQKSSNPDKMDWDGMIIDWECSRYTKQASPRNAKDELERIITTLQSRDTTNKTIKQLISLDKLPFKDTTEDIVFKNKIIIANKHLSDSLVKLGLA